MHSMMLAIPLLFGLATADLYVHNPPGSNNRNRERNENRNNANRMFDSQNNGKGGYPWRGNPREGGPGAAAGPRNGLDPLTYYVGSKIRLEWTNQHACGPNPNIHCELIIQYACDDGSTTADTYSIRKGGVEGGLNMPGLRDGQPSGADNDCWDSSNENANGNQVNCNNPRDGNGDLTFAARRFKSGGQNDEGTQTIPETVANGDEGSSFNFFVKGATVQANGNNNNNQRIGQEFGMHESGAWYQNCKTTAQNIRLYHADQTLNGKSARFTRQNPNGGRRGLECPEERDYYPYWNPNQPWKDAAILTSNTSWCEYFQENSQNVRAYSYCDCTGAAEDATEQNPCPIGESECALRGGAWKTPGTKNIPKPDCLFHPFSRDNHLGNSINVREDGIPDTEGDQPSASHYDWTVPADAVGKSCVLRFRYNMSTADYDSHRYAEQEGEMNQASTKEAAVGIDFSKDCPYIKADQNGNPDDPACAPDCNTGAGTPNGQCYEDLLAESVPLINRPYVNVFDKNDAQSFALGLAINTHQTGRTFQDRSYVFNVAEAPAEAQGKTIWNLNVRGRRGNIVQAYPAVEYDFIPPILNITEDDYVHIQLHGSDFNDNRNANNGEGWEFSDRNNIVQMNANKRGANYPAKHSAVTMFTPQQAKQFALLGQDASQCKDITSYQNNAQQNDPQNCAKLNMAPNRFPADPKAGLMQMRNGNYKYFNTRSNNFSNRSQKGQINVGNGNEKSLSTGGKVGIAFGVIFGVLILAGGIAYWMKVKKLFCFADKVGGDSAYYAHNPALDGAL